MSNNTDKKINIRCSAIKDLSDNNLCNNIITLDFNQNIVSSDNIFGEINGTVNYDGEHKIIVEVLNLDTNEIIREELNNNYFIFNRLVPGDYKIWAYEHINPISKDYFSGTLVPLKQSAKFIIYNKNLYVRANWSNTILMELK